jgi:hypothetical protein
MRGLSFAGVLGMGFFTLAIAAGILTLRKREMGVHLMLLVQALQVLVLELPGSVSWKVAAGPSIIVGMSGPALRVLLDSGSFFQTVTDPGERAVFGVNLLSAAWIWYLADMRGRWQRTATEPNAK